MTQNQLRYLELMQTRARDAWNRDVAEGTLRESTRHNKMDEKLRSTANDINWFNANVNQYNADTNRMNAHTNRWNAATNERNARSNERNAASNERNAASNERNAQSNEANAYSNRMNAYTNQRNASTNLMNAQIAQQRANTEYQAMLHNYEIQRRQTAVQEGNAEVQRLLWSTQADNAWAQMKYYNKSAKEKEKSVDLMDRQMFLTDAQNAKYQAEAEKARSETDLNKYKAVEVQASALQKAAATDETLGRIDWQGVTAFTNAFANMTGNYLKWYKSMPVSGSTR